MSIPSSATKLASADHGSHGQPGSGATQRSASVWRLISGKFACQVRERSGSNQGYIEWHHEREVIYRHASLDELLAVALSEESVPEIRAAIREAIGDAEDAMDAASTSQTA
jgi:hypothetical protein